MNRPVARLIAPFFVALATALVTACGGGGGDDGLIAPPALKTSDGEENGARISVSKAEFAHEVGKTECPQKIGVITIKNIDNAKKLRFTITRGDDAQRATMVTRTSGELAMGDEVNIDLAFLCTQTFDVVEQWIVKVTDENGNRVTDTAVNIKGSVR